MELDHGVWQETIAAAATPGHPSHFMEEDRVQSAAVQTRAAMQVAEPASRLSFWLARLLGLEAFYIEPVSQGSLRRPD